MTLPAIRPAPLARRITAAKAPLCLLAVLCAVLSAWPAAAQWGGSGGPPPDATPLLFLTSERDVVQQSSPFTVRLELLAVVATADERAAWASAFEAARPFEAPWEVVRADDADVTVTQVDGADVLELTRTFVVRVREAGVARSERVAIEVGGLSAEAPPVEVVAYALSQDFYRAGRNVLALVATDGTTRRAGSGFLVAPDALVTAYHVVVGTDRVEVTLPGGGTVTTNKVWALDPARDVAILHVDARRLHRAGVAPLEVADGEDGPAAGAVTLTAGWRDGRQQTSEGRRYADLWPGQRLFVSANAVGPGDSGGPLLDAEGRVLGVVVSGRNTLGEHDLLGEDLALATDLQPALTALAARARPHRLRASLALLERAAPHAQLLKAAAALRVQARRRPAKAGRPYLAALLDAAGRNQDDPTMLFLLGTTLDYVGDEGAAAEAYASALDRAGDFFPAAYALGHHHLRRGDFESAEAYFRQTAAHAGYRHLAALGLARSHTERYDYRAAIHELRAVLRLDPTFAPALYLLAYCHLGLGDEATAQALHVRLEGHSPYWAERLELNLRARPLRPIFLSAVPESGTE